MTGRLACGTPRPAYPRGEPLTHDDIVTGARFSADHSRILTWSIDDSARLWDAETGRSLMLPMRHQGAVREAAFAPVADADTPADPHLG